MKHTTLPLPNCPVCLEQFSKAPINLCKNGHSTCSFCYELLPSDPKVCPICRKEFRGRNYALEDLITDLKGDMQLYVPPIDPTPLIHRMCPICRKVLQPPDSVHSLRAIYLTHMESTHRANGPKAVLGGAVFGDTMRKIVDGAVILDPFKSCPIPPVYLWGMTPVNDVVIIAIIGRMVNGMMCFLLVPVYNSFPKPKSAQDATFPYYGCITATTVNLFPSWLVGSFEIDIDTGKEIHEYISNDYSLMDFIHMANFIVPYSMARSMGGVAVQFSLVMYRKDERHLQPRPDYVQVVMLKS
jgi:hypothetical protein